MKVEIYGSAESHTVRGATVNFNADSAAPVTEFVAEVNPNGFDGRTGVDINKNGKTQSVAFGKTCYGGSANVTTGTLTEEYGGGAYDPQNVPAEVKSEVESKLTLETATPGDIVSFDCELGEYPLKSLTAQITPVQDLHGYDNPWPAGGGKNKFDIDKMVNTSGITISNGVISVTDNSRNSTKKLSELADLNVGEAYILTADTTGPENLIYLYGTGANVSWAFGTSKTTTQEMLDAIVFFYGGTGVTSQISNFMIRPASVTDDTFAPYSNICPISGWTGANIHVSPTTDAADGTTYSITFPSSAGTVYGGTLDVTTGKLTVVRAMLGNVNWSKHNSYSHVFYAPAGTGQLVNSTKGVSNVCVLYSSGNLASFASDSQYRFRIGDRIYINIPSVSNVTELNTWITNNSLQICYELATPLTYTLTTEELTTLLGQNNVWCDAGEISELKYYDGDITDTDIQTENGVLVTGDKLFYALSSPRTSSFTPTAVNTVQGENTMSANTGNIAVTYTSNWFDITPWIAWQGLTFSRNDVDAPNAGRDMSGLMHRGRVGVKEKMNVQTIQLTRAQSSFLQTLLYPETIQVRVTPYPRTNAAQVMSMYTNNVKTTYVIHRQNGEDLQSLSFPLIEN